MTFRRADVMITPALLFLEQQKTQKNTKAVSVYFVQIFVFCCFITSHSVAQTNRHRHGRTCNLNTAYRRHP